MDLAKSKHTDDDANSNMPDYFRSSINRAGDKRTSKVLMQKIYIQFSDNLFINWVL